MGTREPGRGRAPQALLCQNCDVPFATPGALERHDRVGGIGLALGLVLALDRPVWKLTGWQDLTTAALSRGWAA
jgi:hypothetical protein